MFDLQIGDEGARALAAALEGGGDGNDTLRDLHLDFCDIGEGGALALRRMAESNTTLVNLWLHGNPNSDAGSEAVALVEANAARGAAARAETDDGGEALRGRGLAALRLLRSRSPAPTRATSLAEAVAALSLAAYRRECAGHAERSRGQTVLAAFVLALGGDFSPPSSSLPATAVVVSLGMGTKFLAPAVASSPAGARGELVRDSHAEVLAHRGLRRFFHGQACAFNVTLSCNSHATLSSNSHVTLSLM